MPPRLLGLYSHINNTEQCIHMHCSV